MKKSILIFLMILLLSACAGKTAELAQSEAPQPIETFHRESSDDHDDPLWTEQELLTAFYQYAEQGTVVIDCIVLEDSAWGMAGVVQYMTEDYSGCWFDFIKVQGLPRSVGVESTPAGEGTLFCAGSDSVSCRLQEPKGSEYICTVTYYEDPENKETGFKVVSE